MIWRYPYFWKHPIRCPQVFVGLRGFFVGPIVGSISWNQETMAETMTQTQKIRSSSSETTDLVTANNMMPNEPFNFEGCTKELMKT